MKTVMLKDRNYISIGIIEIKAIPTTSAFDEDLHIALKKNTELFSELLTTVTQESTMQNTAIELLCVSSVVTGQIFAAQPHLYLLVRRHDNSRAHTEAAVKLIIDNYIHALSSSSYSVRIVEPGEKDFSRILSAVDESTVYTLEKQVRTGTLPGNPSCLCYTNPYSFDNADNFSRVYEALSRFPNTALSITIIPTDFTQLEKTFIEGVNYYISIPTAPGSITLGNNDAKNYYSRLFESHDKPQYICGMVVMGSQAGASLVSDRLTSILRKDDDNIHVQRIDRSKHLPSYKESLASFSWNLISMMVQNPCCDIVLPSAFKRLPHLLSLSEVLTFFHFPIDDGAIVGIPVNRIRITRETFGKNVLSGDTIHLGHLLGTGFEEIPLGAPLSGFTRHALVVGMPGTGKTTFSINLLLQFYRRGIPFLAIEPTKSEYRAMIDAVPDLQVFTPGKNEIVPFIVNPFLPPEGITLEVFKPSLISAFKAAFSMPSPLDILFANAINACYVKHGWRGYSKRGDPETTPFGLHEFILTFRDVIRTSSYSAETKGNMESAGVFRLLDLVVQNGNIYDTENDVPLQDILRHPTVIELNAIDNQEQKALIMALLLINIIVYTKHNQAGDGKLKNILLIDEAHVLLGGGNTTNQDGGSAAAASTIKTLQNMIVEIRSYGTGIIIADQSPQKVTNEVVGNTDVKVVFQLVQKEDKRLIAASSNMSEEDETQLSRLNTGEAYVYYRGLEAPLRIMTEDIREKENIRLVVPDNELHNRMHYWNDKPNLLKPYRECNLCDICSHCNFKLRDDAKYYVDQFFIKDKAKIRDKQSLLACVLSLDKRLLVCVDSVDQRQLLHCVAIRYIRKAALETPVIFSDVEKERVLNKLLCC